MSMTAAKVDRKGMALSALLTVLGVVLLFVPGGWWLVSLILWGVVALCFAMDASYLRMVNPKKAPPAPALDVDAIAARLRAEKRTRRRKDMEAWDRLYSLAQVEATRRTK